MLLSFLDKMTTTAIMCEYRRSLCYLWKWKRTPFFKDKRKNGKFCRLFTWMMLSISETRLGRYMHKSWALVSFEKNIPPIFSYKKSAYVMRSGGVYIFFHMKQVPAWRDVVLDLDCSDVQRLICQTSWGHGMSEHVPFKKHGILLESRSSVNSRENLTCCMYTIDMFFTLYDLYTLLILIKLHNVWLWDLKLVITVFCWLF